MITFTPPAADGSFTGMFGNTNVDPGVFNDVYTFNLPTGVAAWTISSIFNTAATNNIDFSSVTFNGTPFSVGSTGQVEFRFLQNAGTTAGPQTLVVNGVSGGNATYDGTLAFALVRAGVPEPASWALMMVGFGGLGAMLRAKRRQPLAVTA